MASASDEARAPPRNLQWTLHTTHCFNSHSYYYLTQAVAVAAAAAAKFSIQHLFHTHYCMPIIRRAALNNQALAVSSARTWNALPASARTCTSNIAFRHCAHNGSVVGVLGDRLQSSHYKKLTIIIFWRQSSEPIYQLLKNLTASNNATYNTKDMKWY